MDEYIVRRLKENDGIYRNALERIVEKYSIMDGSGMEVCLQSMTCKTAEGIIPWGAVDTGKKRSKSLKKADDSWMSARERGNGSTGSFQLEVSRGCDELLVSMDTSVGKRSVSLLWESGADRSQLLSSTMSDSCCSHQGALTQPEDQDEELERTLSSQGSTLLDLYPSMLSQMGEACRRQQVAEEGAAVLRRYRRGWFARAHKPTLGSRSGNRTAYVIDNRAPSGQEDLPPSPLHVSLRSPSLHRRLVTIPVPRTPPMVQKGQIPPQQDSTTEWDSGSEDASVAVSPPHRSQSLPIDPRSSPAPKPVPTRAAARLDVCLPAPYRQVYMSSALFSSQLGDRAVRHWIDQEFQKLYRRMLGGNRATPRISGAVATPPRSSRLPRPSPPSSSSSLAALALSPAGTWVRKRIREQSPEPLSGSKRFRGGTPGGRPTVRSPDGSLALVLAGSPGAYARVPHQGHQLQSPTVGLSTKMAFFPGFPSQRGEFGILASRGISSMNEKEGSHSSSRKRLLYAVQ